MIHVGFVVDEKRSDFVIAVVDRQFQGTFSVGRNRVHIRACCDQEPCRFHVPLSDGKMQWREATVIIFLWLLTRLRIARQTGYGGVRRRAAAALLRRYDL